MAPSNVTNTTKRWNINAWTVGAGFFNGWTIIDKFGKNLDTRNTFVPVSLGGALTQLSAAETVDVVSDSANDTLAGTGAQKIVVQGLDSSYNAIEEEVEMDGTSTVVTTKTFLRFFRAKVIQVGSDTSKTNIGTITLNATTTTGATTFIQAAEGQTQTAQYTIPLGMTGYAETVFVASDTNNIITAQLQVKPFGQGWQTKHETKFTAGHVSHDMSGSGAITEKSDVRWIAKADTGINNEVTAGFKILLTTN